MIALVDCNSFFASCEMVFRPDIAHLPVVVLSGDQGCIIAANAKAKSLGIKMFGPYFEMKSLLVLHHTVIFSSNFSLYGNFSKRVQMVLSQWSPNIEVYSIDECFLDLSGHPLDHKWEELGKQIKESVFKNTAIAVSVGIAPTKVLAKAANYLAKKNPIYQGVCNFEDQVLREQALAQIPVEKIWGIGKQSAQKLRALGIRDALEFTRYPHEKKIESVLTKVGLWIKKELQGETCLDINNAPSKRKQIICSRSFDKEIVHFEELSVTVSQFISTAAVKLRKQSSRTHVLSVYVTSNPFSNTDSYFKQEFYYFETPTSDTRKLIRAGRQLLEKIFSDGVSYKKAGIMLSDVVNAEEVQLSLLSTPDSEVDDKLMMLMDKVNASSGGMALRIAACGTSTLEQKQLRTFKSPNYTTSWSQLPVVKCE